MRYLYISFFLCLVGISAFSQSYTDSAAGKSSFRSGRIIMWCNSAAINDVALLIKESRLSQFLVKDQLEGEGAAGATLTFISLKNEKDSLRFAADEQGMVKTSLLKPDEEYKVIVSSVGHRTLSATYKNIFPSSVNQFLLERVVKENEAAVVVGYGSGHCCRIGCICSVIVTYNTADSIMSGTLHARVYPNPLTRGGAVKIEINVQEEKPLQIRIVNLNGSALRSIIYRPLKGMNRIEFPTESQWAAGIYFIQVLDEKRKLLKQDKLLIQ